MIQELCVQLRDKRKELGYGLEYTVEKTKLHPSVIRDIEAGNLANINPTYLKGFIRIYASFLGVHIGKALDELPLANPQTASQLKKAKKEKTQGPSFAEALTGAVKKLPFDKLRSIVFILVGVLVLWLAFVGISAAVRKTAEIFKRKSAHTEAQPDKPVVDPALNFEGAKELRVSLTARSKCFLKVIIDKKVLFEGILDKGALETWKGKKEIELKISDGSAVHLEVNGKTIPTLTSMRKPIKSLKITHSGISVDK